MSIFVQLFNNLEEMHSKDLMNKKILFPRRKLIFVCPKGMFTILKNLEDVSEVINFVQNNMI